jgi:glycerol-3-phosphate dehydrogenase
MVRDLSRLASVEHDVLVIGGGITGLMAAYDAAQRGLSVALVERGDFGGATSGNHFKTIHGGLRYLQDGDLRRMRRSVAERRALARMAPHLAVPLAFLTPTRRAVTRSRLAFTAAFEIDDWIGRDRNDGLPPALHLPAGRVLDADECRRLCPDMDLRDATGGALWHDYQMPLADRLTFAVALGAEAHGAVLANYVEAVAPIHRDGRLAGVIARDVDGGDPRPFEIRARVMLNAAGPWVRAVLAACGVERRAPLLKALNLVTSRPASGPALVQATAEGRALVLAPWGGRAFLGTAESAVTHGPDERGVSEEELDACVGAANATFPGLNLRHDEITRVHRGLVPAAIVNGRPTLQAHAALVDHRHDGLPGLVSAVTVKYTTARHLAEQAIDLLARQLGRAVAPCRTHAVPLPGATAHVPDLAAALAQAHRDWLDDTAARHLAATYGTGCDAVAGLAAAETRLRARISPAAPVLAAEIAHAARRDAARTLTDAVVRRTALGAAAYPGDAAARASAEILARELGWSDDRTADQLAALKAFYDPIPS